MTGMISKKCKDRSAAWTQRSFGWQRSLDQDECSQTSKKMSKSVSLKKVKMRIKMVMQTLLHIPVSMRVKNMPENQSDLGRVGP